MNFSLLHNLPSAIGVVSLSGKILFFNKAFTNITGYTLDDFSSIEEWGEKVYPDETYRAELFSTYIDDIKYCQKTGESTPPRTITFCCKNGKTVILEVSINIDGDTVIICYHDVSEKYSTRSILSNQEERFALIANNTSDIVAVHALDGSFIYISPSCINLLGYKQEELIGENPMEYIHPDDVEPATIATLKAIETNSISTLEHRILLKDGSYKYFECCMNTIKDEVSGKPIGLVANSRDISDRKNYEEKLKLYADIFENITSGILIYKLEKPDDDHTLILVSSNAESEKLTGLKNDDIIGKTIDEIFPELRKKNIPELYANVIRTGQSIELSDFFYEDNNVSGGFDIRAFALPGNKVGVSFTLITEKIIAERALLESQRQYKLLAENVSDIIWIRDLNLKLTYISPSVFAIRGYTPEEAMNLKIEQSMLPSSLKKTKRLLKKALNEVAENKDTLQKTWTFETEIIRKDGTTLWAEVKASFICDDDKNPVGIIGSTRKIDERKKTEEQLKLQNKKIKAINMEYLALNEELKESHNKIVKINKKLQKAKKKAEESDNLKTAFLQNMSHEIRTPMNGIVGFAEIMQKSDLTPEKQQNFLNTILNSSKRLLTVVNDILDISQIETKQIQLHFSNIDIHEVIDDIVLLFQSQAEAKQLTLTAKKDREIGVCVIQTDRDRLSQILTNLVSNAVKFTNNGSVELGYKIHQNFVEFYVNDTGIGIEKSVQNKIFDRFNQSHPDINMKYGGTGLGLAISKGITELLNGKIWVESVPDQGTCFHVELPYGAFMSKQPDNSEEKKFDEQNYFSNLSVLIVEDEDINFLLLNELLLNMNVVNISRAKNGLDAVEYVKINEGTIDIIFMDIKMPVMNGFEATKAIKAFSPEMPVIACTAYAMHADKDKSLEAGCDEHIAKPINKDELVEIIRRFV